MRKKIIWSSVAIVLTLLAVCLGSFTYMSVKPSAYAIVPAENTQEVSLSEEMALELGEIALRNYFCDTIDSYQAFSTVAVSGDKKFWIVRKDVKDSYLGNSIYVKIDRENSQIAEIGFYPLSE